MSHLVVDGLRLLYEQGAGGEDFLALDDVNFAIGDGEFVTIVGPSGCGKSTLLMLIAALLRPSAGSIRLNGRAVATPGWDRALVFQDFALLPWRTVLKNVELGLELKGVAPSARQEIARRHLQMVGLRAFERHFPHQLSGGMRQRVGIARALSVEPEILLMDEPFGALDAQTRTVLQDELLNLWGRVKSTVLFITHDLDEAIYLSDLVVVMGRRPGRIKEVLEVTLPHPRYSYDTRAEKEFARLRSIAWQSIKEEL